MFNTPGVPNVNGRDDPALQGRRLRTELRRLRVELDLSQKDVAEGLDWSTSKILRIEKGTVGVSTVDLRVRRVYPLPRLREFGTRGPELRESLYVPGLLQTPDYAKEIMMQFAPDAPDGMVERRPCRGGLARVARRAASPTRSEVRASNDGPSPERRATMSTPDQGIDRYKYPQSSFRSAVDRCRGFGETAFVPLAGGDRLAVVERPTAVCGGRDATCRRPWPS